MNSTTLQLKRLATIVGLGLGAFALSALAATAVPFVGPLHPAPECYKGEQGCDRPLNEGPTGQTKDGGLVINKTGAPTTDGLWVYGVSTFWNNVVIKSAGGLKIEAGAGDQKVLTSDGSGNATWQPAPGDLGSLNSEPIPCNTAGTNSKSCTSTHNPPKTCFRTAYANLGGTPGASCTLQKNVANGSYLLQTTGDQVICNAVCLY